MNELHGKVGVVTGGCGDIGFTTVKRFLGAGARVLVFDLLQADVDLALQRLDSKAVVGFAGDVTKADDVRRAMDTAASAFGGIDMLVVASALEGELAPLLEYPEDDFDRVLGTNVRGAFLCLREVTPHLHRRGGGSVVVVGSTQGLTAVPHRIGWVASQHALVGLVQCAALELAPLKARVNVIAAGAVEGRMMRSVEEKTAPGRPGPVKARLAAEVPMGRYGLAEEIAELTLFLCSTRASYSTGGVFTADGGLSAR